MQNQIKLQVADNGPGFIEISLGQLPLRTTKRQGSGLGLYVVLTAVENHGGSMSIGRSKKLGGAEITLIFPKADSPQVV
jgi:nitrogen fixation/metabolism regulation signal transduction histidine kinase